MVTGLKANSSVITIGASISETAPGTFTETQVDLNLDPLNREVFVVLACNIDASVPEAIPATDTAVRAQVTSTSNTAMVTIAETNCLGKLNQEIRAFAASGVGFSTQALETPPSNLDYIGIISTNNFFLALQGTANLNAKSAHVKMYGYRARATADIYAALVQSEVLSA
jgi:hypothetical protein